MNEGKLIIFSAPSGSGKTTIVRHLLAENLPLEFSVSACNRPPRVGERHGHDYYFLDTEDFRARVANGDFVEWEEVYAGRFYGTLRSELHRIWAEGKHVLFDVDVAGGVRLKEIFGAQALSVFVQPPSVEALRERLVGRATDPTDEIERRLAKAEAELAFAPRFDVVIVNDDLQTAVNETLQRVKNFI